MTRPNGKGDGVTSTIAPKTHDNQQANFASDGTGGKALATMNARAALCGCTLHELADGGYVVCRSSLSTFAPCLRCVGNLLRRIGGSHG